MNALPASMMSHFVLAKFKMAAEVSRKRRYTFKICHGYSGPVFSRVCY